MPPPKELIRPFITGGAGFIGSHLVARLLAEGCEVTAYDNLSSGRNEWIEEHLGNSRFRFIQADLLDLDILKKAMNGHDVVFHLGANTDVPRGNKITDLDLRNCTIATYNVLEAMRANDIKKILFASSSTTFGEVSLLPTPESIGPLLPISLYGAGKLACEGLISAYCHLFGMQAWILRFANVLGSRMGHGVVYDFIGKLKRNPQELEIVNDSLKSTHPQSWGDERKCTHPARDSGTLGLALSSPVTGGEECLQWTSASRFDGPTSSRGGASGRSPGRGITTVALSGRLFTMHVHRGTPCGSSILDLSWGLS